MIGSIGFGRNSLFFSCNLIGQFCLSHPGNSSRIVIIVIIIIMIMIMIMIIIIIIIIITIIIIIIHLFICFYT